MAIGNKLTFLVGPNSAGKSVVLSALEKLSGSGPSFELNTNLIHKNPRRESMVSGCHSLGAEWNSGKLKYGSFATYFSDQTAETIDTQTTKNIHKYQSEASKLPDENDYPLGCRIGFYINDLLSIGTNKLGSRRYSHAERVLLKRITLDTDQIVIEIASIDEKNRENFLEYMRWVIKIMKEAGEISREKLAKTTDKYWTSRHQEDSIFITKIISDWERYLSDGLFHWDLLVINSVTRDSFSGQTRQRTLNTIERYNSKIEKYKIRLTEKAAASYPGRNFQLSLVSAERGLPSHADLNCHLHPDDDSDNIFHHLIKSKVYPAWGSSDRGNLPTANTTLFDAVNKALSDNLFTDNGYQVRVESKALVSKELWDERRDDGEEININETEFICQLSLVDSHKRSLMFNEVGSGIGYVLPVLIESFGLWNTGKIVFLQQPELHLHPALQTNLTDVLIEASADKRIIAETHSEHMILRALKRIRQTTNGTLQDSTLKLKPEDVAVNYFEPLPDGSTKVHILRISKDGDFLDRWPNGFFEERGQELFDE